MVERSNARLLLNLFSGYLDREDGGSNPPQGSEKRKTERNGSVGETEA
jgi:hypothetical protein